MRVVQDIQHGQIRTRGVEQLSRMYQEMWGLNGNRSIKKAATRALRKGTTIVRRAYKDAAPNGPAKRNPNHVKMRTAARQKVRRPQRRKNAEAKVGYNVGVKNGGRRSAHAHFPTVGTKQRRGPRGRVRPSAIIAIKVSERLPQAVAAIEQEFLLYLSQIP